MKKSLVLALLLLFGAGRAWAGAFEEANEKYRSGDFKAAAQRYEAILKSGKGTAAVEYNLGNSYLRLGKKAQALLAYERALRAEPRNADLRWNIGVVQAMLTDRPEEESAGRLEWLARQASWISIDETARALLVLAVLLALAGLAHFAAGGRMTVLGRFQVFGLVLLLAAAALFALQSREENRRHVIVVDPEVTLRYGPAFSETKAFVLHEGATADVLDESGDWWYASFGKNAGWMPKKAGEIV